MDNVEYHIEVVIANKDEWLQYVTKLVENRGSKSDEQLLEEACTFDFKFETISQSHQSSLTQTRNL